MKKLAVVFSLAAFVAFAFPVSHVNAATKSIEMVLQDNNPKKEEAKKPSRPAKTECCSKKTECKEEKK